MQKGFIHSVLVLALLISPYALVAQGNANNGTLRDKLDAARSLYYSGSFPAAEQAFSALAAEVSGVDVLTLSEIEAFKVLCNISMDRVNAAWSLKVFAEKYPNAPELPMLRFKLASRMFDRCEYEKAGPILDSLRENELYAPWRTEFRFKRAFCRMRDNRREEAASGFQSVIDSPNGIYTYPSLYYLGYVKYLEREFDKAVPLFEKAAGDSRFRTMSQYYCVESKFLQQDYAYVTSHAPELYESLPEDLKANVARIISESYYYQGDVKAATAFLDKLRSSGIGYSRKDHYFSGYLFYGMGQYEKALEDFSKVPGVADSLTQSAWYRMADCYLHLGRRNAAMKAFGNASAIEADPVIREDAFFNYARLCFDLNSDFSKFEEYAERYPDSGKEDVINGYLAASFILSKDYGSAVKALLRINNPTPESVSNLQRASYLRASQFIAEGAWINAIPLLDMSVANGKYNTELATEASFWKAEALYHTYDYGDAAQILKSLLADGGSMETLLRERAQFLLAYCNLKMQNYTEAVRDFRKYMNNGLDEALWKESALRCADALYMNGDYASAAQEYGAYCSMYGNDDIYPQLRGAMAYGLSGNVDRKIDILSEVRKGRNHSPLYYRSLLELGRTLEITGHTKEAAACFEDILTDRSDSSCFSAALLEVARLYDKISDSERALRYYKRIIEDCPFSEELPQAVTGMESICQREGRGDEFLVYLDKVGMASARDSSQKELLVFKSARSVYGQGNWGRSVAALQNYLSEYPDNANTTEALYMLAESLRMTGRTDAAIDCYLKVMHRGGDEILCEKATLSYAELCCSCERFELAEGAYNSLLQMEIGGDKAIMAHLGRMRCFYKDKKWDQAFSDADWLFSAGVLSGDHLRETRYVAAKCLIVKDKKDAAKEHLTFLANDVSDEYGAEAQYLLIFDAYNNGEFNKVGDMASQFSASGTPYAYWVEKSMELVNREEASK